MSSLALRHDAVVAGVDLRLDPAQHTVPTVDAALDKLSFGISMYALRVAGGVVITRVGLSMLQAAASEAPPEQAEDAAEPRTDVAFTPLAMPLLSGPGSMAVTIAMATEVDYTFEYLAVATGIGLVALVAWLLLRSAATIARQLGPTGTDALARVMGFLLACIGVQFVLSGFYEAGLDPRILGPLLEAIRADGA